MVPMRVEGTKIDWWREGWCRCGLHSFSFQQEHGLVRALSVLRGKRIHFHESPHDSVPSGAPPIPSPTQRLPVLGPDRLAADIEPEVVHIVCELPRLGRVSRLGVEREAAKQDDLSRGDACNLRARARPRTVNAPACEVGRGSPHHGRPGPLADQRQHVRSLPQPDEHIGKVGARAA
eukprot:364869-Chlamydomonas_euryale.AAC.8